MSYSSQSLRKMGSELHIDTLDEDSDSKLCKVIGD